MQRRQGFSVLTVAPILIIGAVGGVLGGCTGPADGSDSVASATTQETRSESETATTIPAETTSTTAELTDEEAIISAYQGFWDAWIAANDPPDPNHPALTQYYGGKALEVARAAIENQKQLGQVVRLPENSVFGFTVETQDIADTSATMTVCFIDDGLLIDAPTGLVLDGSVASSRISVELERQAQGWKVIENNFLFTVSGAGGCGD